MNFNYEKYIKRPICTLSIHIMPGILDSNFNGFIMKLVDDFLTKVGADKILHHVVGALICAIFSISLELNI